MRWRIANWSNLDEELLADIADHIDCLSNLKKFRSVCRTWRSSACFSTHLLYSTLPRQILTNHYVFRSLLGCENRLKFLVGSVVYLIQPLNQIPNNSQKFWVVSLEESNPGLLQIRYPLTKIPIDNIPKNFPKLLNSLDFRVSLIGKGFKFCFSDGSEGVFGNWCAWKTSRNWNSYPTITKVVLYNESDLEGVFDHAFVVLWLDQGGVLGALRLGNWYYLGDVDGVCFDDIVNFKGKVCAIDSKGVAYLIDGRESRKMNAISGPVCAGDASDRRKLLVESHGKLYIIVRECYKFRVYRLNEGKHKWDEVNSLEDRILFVTFDGCYFVEAHDIVGCRGNCIFFPKNCFPNYSGEYYPDDELFKGASKYLEIGVFYLGEDRARLISSYPGLSDMFWPLPSWIWSNSSSFTW